MDHDGIKGMEYLYQGARVNVLDVLDAKNRREGRMVPALLSNGSPVDVHQSELRHVSRARRVEVTKERALAACDEHRLEDAFLALMRGLLTHPKTRDNAALQVGAKLALSGQLSTAAAMRAFIESVR